MVSEKKERFGFFKKIREYWKVPRYRALMTLGLYGIFFVGIYLYIEIMNVLHKPITETEPINSFDRLNLMTTYEYDYNIDYSILGNGYGYTVSGTFYYGDDSFRIGNDSFYVDGDIIYSSDGTKNITDIIQVDLLLLRPEKIHDFLSRDGISASKTEYKNGDAKIVYQVPAYMFNIAFLQGLSESSNGIVEIVTYETDNQIYKIDLNIYELMKFVDPNYESYNIQIMYSNINNIREIEELN